MSRVNNSDNYSMFERIEKLDPKTSDELHDIVDDIAGVGDDIEKIFNYYRDTYNRALKYAKKFYIAFDAKNPIDNLSPEDFIVRAKKYKNKYNLSDNEFTLFLKMVKERRAEKMGRAEEKFLNTSMSKTLGYERRTAKLNVSPNDQNIVNEIIKLDRDNIELSRRVKLQSFSYGGPLKSRALLGTFNAQYDNAFNAINPTIAALFIPKIDYFEQRIVYADIANMVSRLAQHKHLIDGPTNNLYQDLIHDPNQNSDTYKLSPIKDLSLRAQIQTCLWEIIINLRNGKYYNSKFTHRLDDLLNKYPTNNYDATDVNLANDAGAWLRRLMNVFSLRPTNVGRTKHRTQNYQTYKMLHEKPDYVDLSEFVEKEELEDTAFIPMIVIRLPPRNLRVKEGSGAMRNIRISADLGLLNWYKNDNAPTIYNQKIIATDGVIIFYINRTYSTVNYVSPYIDRYGRDQNMIYDKLPPSIAGATNLNTIQIGFDPEIVIDNTVYSLQSVICYENMSVNMTDAETLDIAVGQSAIINTYDDTGMGIKHYWYNPMLTDNLDNKNEIHPVTMIDDVGMSEQDYSYEDYVSKYGSVFIYADLSRNK